MENYCAYSKNHKCIKWMDYELTRQELEEADRGCKFFCVFGIKKTFRFELDM